ncbi:MAG: 16S rRNA (guanine(966)-N(2))-methyltransferase RsmD [Oscillospiraceae bacterium]|jgi:16S rRNA (guanine966-N2)-methyltransferase
MRIITGAARGRKLKEPVGMEIRPTSDMVKEAMFNIIQFDIEGRRVLDLFAGSGQLGIEALSRGASSAVFVDQSRGAVELVRENLKLCKFEGEVVLGDSLAYLERCGKFDIIFIDPPYDSGLADKALHKIFKFDILSDGGIIVCETMRELTLPVALPPYFKSREYYYGKVKLTVYGKEA